MVGPARIGGIMALSTRPRRSRRPKKTPVKKRKASGAAGRPRKAMVKRAVAKTPVARQGVKAATKDAAPGIVEAALAAFAHEVRTPLTGILAISDLLATSDLGERERRWVDTIKAGAEHLASLANLFVDAAKDRNIKDRNTKDDATGLREDLFDLRALARNVGDSLAGRAAAEGLKAKVDMATALTPLAVGDPVRLRAALENLVDNAVKFTEHGGVALQVTRATVARGRVGAAFA